jgi:hypothetical protein
VVDFRQRDGDGWMAVAAVGFLLTKTMTMAMAMAAVELRGGDGFLVMYFKFRSMLEQLDLCRRGWL